MKIILNDKEAEDYLTWRAGTCVTTSGAPTITSLDTDTPPFVPSSWTIDSHRGMGMVDPSKIRLHLEREQKDGTIGGLELEKRLKDLPTLNACVLDYLLINPHLIPEECKGKYTCFWGTVYRDSDADRVVRYLYWSGSLWDWDCYLVDCDFVARHPAVVYAS